MKRRNFLGLGLAALLPCSFLLRKPKPVLIPQWSNPERFSFSVHELGERRDQEGNRLPPCFRAFIRDNKTNSCAALQSSPFTNSKELRAALDGLYQNIGYVVRRRQFPDHTLIYDTEEGGIRNVNPRYPV